MDPGLCLLAWPRSTSKPMTSCEPAPEAILILPSSAGRLVTLPAAAAELLLMEGQAATLRLVEAAK